MWWTLTDEISTNSLRDALKSPTAHATRYQAASASGLEPALAEENLSRLKFYINFSQTPELTPMWYAFHEFADYWLSVDGDLKSRSALAGYGMSSNGVVKLLAAASRDRGRAEVETNRLAPLQRQFIEMQWEIQRKRGGSSAVKARVETALRDRDSAYFARESGKSAEVVKELLEAGRQNPTALAATRTLVELHGELESSDWEALRRYFLDQAATRLSTFKDFSE